MIEQADNQTVVILDEMGTGTDPIECMWFAIAILKRLYNKSYKILQLLTVVNWRVLHFAMMDL